MIYHLINTRLLTCLFFGVGMISLGVFGGAANAEHGTKTWAKAQKSLVAVNPVWPGYDRPGFGAPPGTAPAGTGVYFSINSALDTVFILTAAHVVAQAKSIEIVDFSGKSSPAYLHAIDWRRDIAILKTDLIGTGIIVNNERPLIGSHVCALGNSFGLGTGMSCGIVSAVGRSNVGFNEIEDFIQTDAAVNPGMSGGALVDSDGRLIGLIGGIFTKEADIDAGVNFAISVPLLRQSLAEHLTAGVRF